MYFRLIMQIYENCSLVNHNTFHIEAVAEKLVRIEQEKDILTVLAFNQSLNILGGGSNILFTKNPAGVVCLNQLKGITILEENNDFVRVEFGSGEVWHDCVLWAIDRGYGGIENLSLIPGTIGAAPLQNIGAYGVELKDVFYSLNAIHRSTLEHHTFSKEQCNFGYRESVFKHALKNQYFITSVTLELSKKPVIRTDYGSILDELKAMHCHEPYSIKQVSDAVIRIRSSKLPDPKDIGNAGSFFKNPVISQEHFNQLKNTFHNMPSYPAPDGVKIPAAWLIEQCGWKGFKEGNYGVHPKQALVLVNYGGSSGEQLYHLSERIIQSVLDKFQITLHREVNVW